MKTKKNRMFKVLIISWLLISVIFFSYQEAVNRTHFFLLAAELIMIPLSIYYLVLCYRSGEDISQGYIVLVYGIYMVMTLASYILSIQWLINHSSVTLKLMFFLSYLIVIFFEEKDKKDIDKQSCEKNEERNMSSYFIKKFDLPYYVVIFTVCFSQVFVELANSRTQLVISLAGLFILICLEITRHFVKRRNY